MFFVRVIFFLIIEKILPGFVVKSFWSAVGAAILYGIVSFFLRPILKLISLPINLLTLGLFNFVITGMLFLVTAKFSSGLEIESIGTAILGAVVLSILQAIVERQSKKA